MWRVVTLAVLIACTSSALAEARLVAIGEGAALSSDGSRWATWASPGGRTIVADEITARRLALTPPERCDPRAALGGGFLLWSCVGDSRRTEAAILDLSSGDVVRRPLPPRVAALESEAGQNVTRLGSIGRHWIVGAGPVQGTNRSAYVPYFAWEWRTERTRFEGEGLAFRRLPDPRTYADLDHPELERPLCRALRPSFTRHAGIVAIRGGYAIRTTTLGGLRLERCGAPARRLTRCGGPSDYDCGGRQLGRGHAMFTRRGRVYVYDIARRTFLRTRRLARRGSGVRAALAGSALYVEDRGRILRRPLTP